MIGLSIPQFVEVTEFIQKHHPFGYVREENQLPKIPHGYCIKYIDSTYDTRDGSYWHLKFRGFGETILNANFTPKEFANYYEWVKAFLNGDWEPFEWKKERDKREKEERKKEPNLPIFIDHPDNGAAVDFLYNFRPIPTKKQKQNTFSKSFKSQIAKKNRK